MTPAEQRHGIPAGFLPAAVISPAAAGCRNLAAAVLVFSHGELAEQRQLALSSFLVGIFQIAPAAVVNSIRAVARRLWFFDLLACCYQLCQLLLLPLTKITLDNVFIIYTSPAAIPYCIHHCQLDFTVLKPLKFPGRKYVVLKPPSLCKDCAVCLCIGLLADGSSEEFEPLRVQLLGRPNPDRRHRQI